jgi:tetrahydromethanopterin S-methyltransferase subunit F
MCLCKGLGRQLADTHAARIGGIHIGLLALLLVLIKVMIIRIIRDYWV